MKCRNCSKSFIYFVNSFSNIYSVIDGVWELVLFQFKFIESQKGNNPASPIRYLICHHLFDCRTCSIATFQQNPKTPKLSDRRTFLTLYFPFSFKPFLVGSSIFSIDTKVKVQMPSSYWTIKLRPVLLFVLKSSDSNPDDQLGSLSVWIELVSGPIHRWRSTHNGISNTFYLQIYCPYVFQSGNGINSMPHARDSNGRRIWKSEWE